MYQPINYVLRYRSELSKDRSKKIISGRIRNSVYDIQGVEAQEAQRLYP
jgi:hypothetical protein